MSIGNELLGVSKRLGAVYAEVKWFECVQNKSKLRELEDRRRILSHKKRKIVLGMSFELTPDEIEDLLRLSQVTINESREVKEREIERDYRPPFATMDKSAFQNATDVMVPEDVAMALSWGPKFTFPYILNKDTLPRYLAQLEVAMETTVPTGTYDMIGLEIVRALKIDHEKYDSQVQWLLFLKHRVQSFLKINKLICPLLSDKGKIVILMNKQEYEDKLTDHLADTTHYEMCTGNPLSELVARERELLNELRQETQMEIPAYEFNCMALPKFYGTIKIHKGNKLRPITSNAGNTVGATLNTIFNDMLTSIFPTNGPHVLNAKELVDRLASLSLDKDDIMVSFDATSMFTNIPTSLIMYIVGQNTKKFERTFGTNTRLPLKIAHFLLNECTFFLALDKIYRQKEGLPMGGAISPICCRLTMDYILNKTFQMVPMPLFHAAYVDDTFFIVKEREVQPLLAALNSVTPIAFTYEREMDKKLNFLNVTLHRKDTTIVSNWYQKPYSSNRLLNYFSSHKRSTILNTARQFITTVITLSDPRFFNDNKERVSQVLRDNSFPEDLNMILVNETYTYMRKLTKNEEEKLDDSDKTFVAFPHQLRNKAVKDILHAYKAPSTVLAESIKNNKINFIKNIKTCTRVEKRGNMIVKTSCQCGEKIDIRSTRFNETAEMIIENNNRGSSQCMNERHSFTQTKCMPGMNTTRQTAKLCAYQQWLHKDKLINKTFAPPNRHFSKLL